MALDTRNKRASAVGLGLMAQLVLPAPGSGTSGLAVRLHLAGLYASGAAATYDGPGQHPLGLTLTAKVNTMTLSAKVNSLTLEA